jgi:hypothetical protein
MSDGEPTTPAPRKRPSFGLPGPTQPAPGTDPQSGPPQHGAPQGRYGAPQHDSSQNGPSQFGSSQFGSSQGSPHEPHGAFGEMPATGPLPPSVSSSLPSPGGSRPKRRRGVLPLVIGLVLLVVIAPVATVVGIIWSVSSLVGDASSGPTPMEASSTLELSAQEMVIVYVPAEDAATAECTAEGTSAGDLTTVPSSTSTTFGDGSEYVQVLGVASLQDTTATISCTGTDAPAHLGPYSLFGMMAPLVIGPIIGVVSGLVGLVLTIVGIVLLVRSRRA